MSKPLEDYVEVSERIVAFYEKYPEGSLQGKFWVTEAADDTLIVYKASAYRTPDDERPAVGFASEPYPGQTNFTRGSELMNAETSAWGRAIAALGFEVKRGIASRQEVANRRNGDAPQDEPASPKQKSAVTKIFRKAQATDEVAKAVVHKLAGNPPTKAGMSKVLDVLMNKDDQRTIDERVDYLVELADVVPPSDVPADLEGLPEPVSDEEATGTVGGDE